MIKMTRLLAASGAALLSLSAAPAALSQQAPKPNFAVDEAAYCTATFGWVMQVLVPNGLPKESAMEAEIAFMIWNYELNLASPNASQAEMKTVADRAIAKLSSSFPEAKSQQDAQKVVQYVSGEASECGRKLEKVYPDGRHPVLAAVRQRSQEAAQANAQAAKAPAPKKPAAKKPAAPTAVATAAQPAPQPQAQPAAVMPPDSALPLGTGLGGGTLPLGGGSLNGATNQPLQLQPLQPVEEQAGPLTEFPLDED